MNAIPLSALDLLIAASLLVVNGVLSIVLQLRLERALLISALRMVVQLTLVGLVLTTLFELASPWWTGLAALAMVLFAGREIMARQERRLTGFWAYGLGTACMLVASCLVTTLRACVR